MPSEVLGAGEPLRVIVGRACRAVGREKGSRELWPPLPQGGEHGSPKVTEPGVH